MTRITRKFIWIRDRRYTVFCVGGVMVAVSEFDLAKEIA